MDGLRLLKLCVKMSPVRKKPHPREVMKKKKKQKKVEKKEKKKLAEQPVPEAEDTAAEKKDRIKRKAGRLLFLLAILFMLLSIFIYNDAHSADTSYKGTPWYKMYTPDSVDLKLPEEENAPKVYETLPVAYGNSREFASAGSIAAEDDRYFYIADPSKEGFLFSISKADRSRTLLNEIPASEAVLIKGRLYFINPTEYGDYKAGLYSCATNGASLRYILEGSFRSLHAEGNILYYVRSNDSRLYSYDISKYQEKKVCGDKCISYTVYGNTVYYITSDESRTAGADKVICRMDINGEGGFHLTEYGNYGDIGFIGDKLAFVVYDEGYCLIDPDSDVTISLSSLGNKLVKMKGLYSLPVEREGSLWYIDRSRDRQLVRRDMQTKKEEEMDIYNVTSFYIMKDSIVIGYMEDGIRYCICSRLIDGWEPAALFEGEL